MGYEPWPCSDVMLVSRQYAQNGCTGEHDECCIQATTDVRAWCGECMVGELVKRLETVRSALVGLVGVDGRTDLEQMEAVIRLMPAPEKDKAVTIDAIDALLVTLEEPVKVDAVDPVGERVTQ